jgi:CHASE2 domain-containing sensor protein
MRHVLTRHHGARRKRPHQRETSLAFLTIAGGLVAFVCGIVQPAHLVACVVGLATVLFGLYSQLVSATTAERWINVIGIGLAVVGLGLGLSHGGFTL